jgi:hypothetical protein
MRISYRGLLAESAVIFASVLAALWADALWQDRSDRRLEQYYLQALRAEMEVALEELDVDQRRRAAQLVALDSLIDQLGRLGTAPEDVTRWVDDVGGEFVYSPPETVMNEISETGRLQLFESAELRTAIMRYRRARARLAGQEEMSAALGRGAYVPHVLARAPRTLRGEANAREADNLLLDEQFHTLLDQRRYRVGRTQGFGNEVRESIEEILALLAVPEHGAP